MADMKNSSANLYRGELDDVEYAIGKSIYTFLKHGMFVESSIGDVTKGSKHCGGDAFLKVIGMQSGEGGIARLLGSISIPVEQVKVLNSFNGKSPFELLGKYMCESEELTEEAPKYMELLTKFITNKHLSQAIKLDRECELTLEDEGKSIKRVGRIASIEWRLDKETGKMQCFIVAKLYQEFNETRVIKVNITEYNKTLKLTDTQSGKKTPKHGNEIIKMSRFGYIKPILIVNKKGNGIALDATTLYSVNSGVLKILGEWQLNSIDGTDKFDKFVGTPEFEILQSNIDIINKHRRIIAPAFISTFNTIEI